MPELPEVERVFGVRMLSSWGMTEVVTNVLVGDLDVPGTPRVIGRVAPEYGIRVVDDEGRDDRSGRGASGSLRSHAGRAPALRAGHVHGGLVGLQGDQRVFDRDHVARCRNYLDDFDVAEVAEIGNRELDGH